MFAKMKDQTSATENVIYSFCWNFFGSLLIGTLTGLACAFFLKNNAKKTNQNPESLENKEATIMFIIPWVCYLLADVFLFKKTLSEKLNF